MGKRRYTCNNMRKIRERELMTKTIALSDETKALIEKTAKRVQAILDESGARAMTGRERHDVGTLPEGATATSIIDHTLLKADATARQIEKLCFEAREYGFASVCVNSYYVPLAKTLLDESDVAVCTVVGFPLGATLPHVKAYEAAITLEAGADEIDMVIPIGALKNRDLVALFEDITDVAHVCHDNDAICKVIIETALLDEEEKIIACQVAKMAGADFVKTSTGFSTGGATLEDIALMRAVVGDGVGVKASGGVRNLEQAQAMMANGANRIGASAGVSIAQEEGGNTTSNANNDDESNDESTY
jgi:deoxyribose-phosphate aldolase